MLRRQCTGAKINSDTRLSEATGLADLNTDLGSRNRVRRKDAVERFAVGMKNKKVAVTVGVMTFDVTDGKRAT